VINRVVCKVAHVNRHRNDKRYVGTRVCYSSRASATRTMQFWETLKIKL